MFIKHLQAWCMVLKYWLNVYIFLILEEAKNSMKNFLITSNNNGKVWAGVIVQWWMICLVRGDPTVMDHLPSSCKILQWWATCLIHTRSHSDEPLS